MLPKKQKGRTAAQKKADAERKWVSRLRLRLQRDNASAPAAPPRNPATDLAAANLPSAKRDNYVSTPANGRSAQLSIRLATVSTLYLVTLNAVYGSLDMIQGEEME